MSRPRRPLKNKLQDKYHVSVRTGCWLWHSTMHLAGYGVICDWAPDGRRLRLLAHRVLYQLHRGEIPKELTVDHLCRRRNCVNPWHMELVTNRENILRGKCFAARYAKRTRCKHGHKFTPENTRHSWKRGIYQGRACRACGRSRAKKRWPVIRAAYNAARRTARR